MFDQTVRCFRTSEVAAPTSPSESLPRVLVVADPGSQDTARILSALETASPAHAGSTVAVEHQLVNLSETDVVVALVDDVTDPLRLLAMQLELLHAVMKHGSATPIKIMWLIEQTGEQASACAKAMAAFCRVVTEEDPDYRLRTVVFERSSLEPQPLRLVAELSQDEEWVRLTSSERLVLAIEPTDLPKGDWPSLGSQEAVIISGGAGELGLTLSAQLLQRSDAQVIMVGRHAETASKVQRALSTLSRERERVRYAQCDITDTTAVAALCDGLRQEVRIRGVIHSAGLVDDSFARMKSVDAAVAVAAPKVAGFHALAEATRDDSLAFFMTISSLAGTFANVGQSDYAFANAFLDAMMEERATCSTEGGPRYVSVALPALRGTDLVEHVSSTALANGISCEQAAAACARSLGGHGGVLAVTGAAEADLADTSDPDDGVPAATSLQEIEGFVLEIVRHFTKLDAEDCTASTTFQQMGVESILALSMTAELEKRFGRLPKTLFFEHENVRELAARLAQRNGVTTDDQEPRPESRSRTTRAIPEHRDEAIPAKWRLLAARGAALSGRASHSSSPATGDIAIVGMAGRYPKAPDLEVFWRNLRDGVDAITEVPASRWDHDAIFDPNGRRPGTTSARWGGFLDKIDSFDPLFFGISPAEANYMDPQERLFLQTAWHAVEEAGYRPDALRGERIGVFVGAMFSHYQLLSDAAGVRGGASFSSIANRVSWTLGLRGPSIAVDTMCSSSLSALHMALQSLADGGCRAAIVGGVNVMPHPSKFVTLSQAGFLSSDGRCRSFGAGGDGYVPAEGVGAVLVKPLEAALTDGDHIHAVIKGSALNAAGRTNGFTVPSPAAEGDVIAEALRRSGVDRASISYIEAHGTGTALGDPIEVIGLQNALSPAPSAPVWIGSVKSSIGHAESAAGIAALTKVVLQLEHDTIAPSLHSAQLNPHLDLAEAGFKISQEAVAWPNSGERPRVAGISAFGAGGSNAHVIVASAPAERLVDVDEAGSHVVVLSAPDEDRLAAVVESWRRWLHGSSESAPWRFAHALDTILGLPVGTVEASDPLDSLGLDQVGLHRALSLVGLSSLPADARTVGDVESESASRISSSLPSLAAIAMTSQCGRQAFACRLALVVSSLEELSTALDCVAQGESHPSVLTKPADAASLSFMLGADFTTSFAADALAHHRWEDVARLWVAGVNVDWEVAWQHSRPTRASLPLYPFREGSCWLIPVGAGEPLAKSGSASEASEAPVVTKPVHRADVSEIVLDVFSTVLAIPRERLTSSGTLEGYGVDSIRVRQLLTALEEVLPGIPVSLMFEAETVGDVVQAIQRLYPDGAPEVPSSTQQSRCEVAARTVTSQGDIAVIGMAGRFPGASDVDALARRLIAGDDLISEVPAHRWDWTRYPDHQVRWGGFISDERCFDAEFFGISPSTAAYLDPQERVLLECAWHCVSDAGYVPPAMAQTGQHQLTPQTGVYMGVSFKDYALFGAQDMGRGVLLPLDSQHYSSANRISYHLDLHGPSVAMDTACSSSLTALHAACADLRVGRVDAALAGGANLLLHPAKMLTLDSFGFVSDDGHCHSFGDGGNGYVPADGVGTVLLKRLEDAERDGDRIYAVIRGTAVNHGGRMRGYTVPSIEAQAALVGAALADGDVDPRSVSLIEAHGTGTDLGDPVEVEALGRVFADVPQGTMAMSSIKGNIGHAEAAAGIAQMIKVLLQLRDRKIYPHCTNSTRVNPLLGLEQTPFRLPDSIEPWECPVIDGMTVPRRAAISSFGAGGANAHVVVEEATAQPDVAPRTGAELLVFSATNPTALRRQIEAFVAETLENEELSLADVATTLRLARPALNQRLALVAGDLREAREQLRFFLDGSMSGLHASTPQVDAVGVLRDRPTDGELDSVAGDWVAGTVLWGSGWQTGRTTALKGYSFARDEHWLYSAVDDPQAPLDPARRERDTTLLERLAHATDNERHDEVESTVRSLIAAHLGYEQPEIIDGDRGFFDLGLDSITSMDLVNALETEAGRELDPQMFFNFPTVNRLTEYLLEQLTVTGDDAVSTRAGDVDAAITAGPLAMISPDWQAQELSGSRGNVPDRVLLMDVDGKVAEAFANLEEDQRPQQIVHVTFGEEKARESENHFVVRAGEVDDLRWVIEEIGEPIDHAVYWWNQARAPIEEQVESSFYAVLALCQAFQQGEGQSPRRVVLGFKTARKAPAPAAVNALSGLANAVRLEAGAPSVSTLEISHPSWPWPAVAQAILDELRQEVVDTIVRRRPEREVRRFTSVQPHIDELPLRERGTYLVTGGAGGLGSLFAKELASRYQATVILLGRRPSSPETDKLVSEIEDRAGHAEYVSFDISDAGAMSRCVEAVTQRYGVIHGVIHAAGVTRDSALAHKTPEEAAAVLAPKVAGTRALLEATVDQPLEMFVAFSSVASVLGNFGQSDYCYANAFLDHAMSQAAEERAGKWLSIAWSFWDGVGGMPASDGVKTWMRSRMGIEPLGPDDAWTGLSMALSSDEPHVIVTKGDLNKLSEVFATSIHAAEAHSDDLAVVASETEDIALDDLEEDDLAELLCREMDAATKELGQA
ncbi:SDR family NAD(P)-dependent oxidoreductase [Cutibacterium avidum]|uniref:Polyketide synthase n=1 Tax=Cutibacterium avidum TaxID=33010 RepID=A0A3E2DGS3_9ACTN|nr:SDR family NAD(P)-dependent oxidoreductase [Cutibacterium avidum]MDU7817077.1 SDR family NAD(P)-dependent oxidoreductase [Bacillota bacterium]MDU3219732.1 SDR family NAD(P)-dependent oxidoreductase [Cutibacterium avidum]MDU5867806.1 SDR family NAD(P)-dependent oxidoreductase [Cutibacterium avidum]MDU8016410.1 SDR family NAD(P)-dependent oxidoreductase [Cutibacterium avidum]RFT44586.1 hypothetical protein CHT91_07140 [Cutibacterium avidum]